MCRFRLSLLVSLLVAVLFVSGCTPEYDREHKNDEYERGYESGYKNGYEEGILDSGLSAGGDVYYAIEDMAYSDVVAFIEGDEEHKVISYEDLDALIAYAVQRGYVAGKTGTWDDALEEYVNGYSVADLASGFERSYFFSQSDSPAFRAWQKWVESTGEGTFYTTSGGATFYIPKG